MIIKYRAKVMKLIRRQILHMAAGAVALPALACLASAQTYPSRPVHLIVGYAPGGGTDIAARLIGQWLSERLGQPLAHHNRGGARGNIGTQTPAPAPPDPYPPLLPPPSHPTPPLPHHTPNTP